VEDVSAGEALEVPRNEVLSGRLPSALIESESLRFPDLYAASLPNARILGNEGNLILDDRLVLDMSPHYGHGPYDHMALTRRRLPRPQFLDVSALVLTGIDARNHYHWLLDILPRYEVARRSGLDWDCVIAADMTPVHRACFQRLDIDTGTLIAPRYGKQFVLREAIVGNFPSLRYSPSPFAVGFVRELFSDCMQTDQDLPSRIYISRRKCAWRRIRNEAEVEQMLSDLGFKSVALEQLAFEEQVRLFANADLIVAPHGAGLANCAFCRPGTRLVEVFGKDYTPGFFRRLAAICNLEYACMVEGNSRRAREDTLDLRQDMGIDVAQLRRLVTRRA
jgi:capsular polysaccharide biosynthesis protein